MPSRSGSSPAPAAGPTGRTLSRPALARAIERRLAGDRRARIELDLRGSTEFEQAVWLKALEIPRGEVRPYGWVAAEIGRPKAVRAVGTALGHNPVPLIVPCHRVVRSDGTIGQYSLGGPGNKRTILAAEGLDPDELERLARGRGPLRRLGHDPDLLPADLPQREADHAGPPGGVPLDRRVGVGRLPGVPGVPPERRGLRRGLSAGPARCPAVRAASETLLHSRIGPADYANRAARRRGRA